MELFSQFFSHFHFLRPLWLLALLPAVLLFVLLLNARYGRSQWQSVIDPDLLPFMLDYTPGPRDRQHVWWLLMGWLLASLALAGPTWQQTPQPVFKNQQALVIMLDMSYSMAAEDVKPSRYQQVNHKVTDILRARQDGLTALITYAGAAHTVTPLTDDADTITNLLPSLSPYIMPKPGSRPDRAIELAQQLVNNGGQSKARLLLITDGIQPKDVERIDAALDQQNFTLSVLAVGTEGGAPIPLPKGGFLKDGNGTMVLPQLNTRPIERLSSELGIRWRTLSLGDDDWHAVLDLTPDVAPSQASDDDADEQTSRQFDLWLDQGYWLLLLVLPVALLSFRRGVLFSHVGPLLALAQLSVLATSVVPSPACALEWKDLWQTPDQQASRLMESDPNAAAQTFEDSAWRGSAAYRAGDYATAIESFAQDKTAQGHYNRGNALARSGQLQDAINAYDQALALDPGMTDAQDNQRRVQAALDQQKQEQQNQDQKSQNDPNSDDQQQDGQNQDSGDSSQNDQQQNRQTENQKHSDDSSSGSDQEQQEQSDQQDQTSNAEQSSDDSEAQTEEGQRSEQRSDEPKGREQDSSSDDEQENGEQPLTDERVRAQEQAAQEQELTQEQQTQLKQWLNRVPDQPGKLMERKFLYQYQQQYRQSAQEEPEDVLW